MDDEIQAYIDEYKRDGGIIDWYEVLDVPPESTAERIEMAFFALSATYHPETGVRGRRALARYVLVQQAYREIGNPIARKKYDAFRNFERDHARLLVTLDAAKQRQRIGVTPPHRRLHLFFSKTNTRAKRIALLCSPFLAVIALYRLVQDLSHYRWEPSLSFLLFSMATVLCLLIAFTRVGDWVRGDA